MRLSVPVSAFVAAVVGFGGTLALIIAAADAVGASHEQTASMVTALCLAMAVETMWLSWRTKMPVITAWSTPGAALIGASTGFTINEAVGAFMLVGLMLIVTGLFKPLTRLISRIPASIASGMLAGIVVTFAINAVKTIPSDPLLILPLIAAFFVIRLFNPALSVLAVLVGGGLLAVALGRVGALPAPEMSTLTLTAPEFSLAAAIGLALPLYLVTMASQNLSGLAVLRAAGYEPAAGPLIAVTGLFRLSPRPSTRSPPTSPRSRRRSAPAPMSIPIPPSAGRQGRSTRLPIWSSRCSAPRWSRYSPSCRHASSCWWPVLALLAPLANALAIALRDESRAHRGDRRLRGHGFRAGADGHRLGILGPACRTCRARSRPDKITLIHFRICPVSAKAMS